MSDASTPVRTRREPPPYRRVAVERVEHLGPRMVRVTFSGSELAGLTVDEPAASVRLLVPSPGASELVMPAWNGNEFLLPDGSRPAIRTFTPRRLESGTLDLDVVLHGGGLASAWAAAAQPGDRAAISGTGRGYTVDPDARAFLLAGDETAIPAIGQLLEVLPPEVVVEVHIEVARPDGRIAIPHGTGATVAWHDLAPGASAGTELVAAVTGAHVEPGTRVWVAGEAAAVQRVRRHLFEERALPRTMAWVRGYWKRGRSGDGDDTADHPGLG